MLQNTEHLVKNTTGKIFSHKFNEESFPIFISSKKMNNNKGNCWITSLKNLQVFELYSWIENLSDYSKLSIFILKFIVYIRKIVAGIAKIDHAVYFNATLTSTTLWPENLNNIEKIKFYLKEKFPTHPIIFRSFNYEHNANLIGTLKKNQFHLLKTRRVVCFDSKRPLNRKQRKRLQSDLKTLKTFGYRVVQLKTLTQEQLQRICELYQMLYLNKYNTEYGQNPEYSIHFFEKLLSDSSYKLFTLQKDKIDAFFIIQIKGHVMQSPCIGYDLALPKKLGLYRQIFALFIEHGIKNNLQVNGSSGVTRFKLNRGCFLTPEYYAIYIDHLPLLKRYSWHLYLFIIKHTWNYIEKKIYS